MTTEDEIDAITSDIISIGPNMEIKEDVSPKLPDFERNRTNNHPQLDLDTNDALQFDRQHPGHRIYFSNMIIRSELIPIPCNLLRALWHLNRFRDHLLETSFVHVHVMNGQRACIICALCAIFSSLNEGDDVSMAYIETISDNLLPAINALTMAEKRNAASQAVMLKSLHISHTCMHFYSGAQGACSKNVDNCTWYMCLAHCQFGINIYVKMKCKNCTKEPRCSNYISFFWKADASLLQKIKVERFEELLKILQVPCFCDDENNCSGEQSNVDCFLENTDLLSSLLSLIGAMLKETIWMYFKY